MAYQGIIGVSYAVSDQVSVSADYRYFATKKPTYDKKAYGDANIDSGEQTTDVNTGNEEPTGFDDKTNEVSGSQYSGEGSFVTNNFVVGLTYRF